METKGSFKVIIIGASVTGLTLAHCLHRAGINYVVLEKHAEIHPPIGAAVAIMPNGARIMEQPGSSITLKGSLLQSSGSIFVSRTGSTMIVFLPVSYLRDSASNSLVFTSKDVATITPHGAKVSVTTAAGEEFQGDLIVGADGVHSLTRREMWRVADLEQPGRITLKEKRSMGVEFRCIFGMSNPIPGRKGWQHVIRFGPGFTILIFPAVADGLFWVLIEKLPRKYIYPDAPCFSQDKSISHCEGAADLPIWDGVRFRDIWAHRREFRMVALEENLFRTWHHGRIVCIGDSMSKMTPNIGQEANTAMEAAAGLANMLHAITQDNKLPSTDTIEQALTMTT